MHRAVLFAFLLLSLAALSGCGQDSAAPLRIVHWNDYHAANLPARMATGNGDTLLVGGAATLAGYVNHYRADDVMPTLALHAGDDFQGTPISSVTRGRSQVELLNAIRPDAFTIGNHEFDYGMQSLVTGMGGATFPVLLANVVRVEDNARLYPADTVLTADGIEVGVVGVITDELREVTTAKATAGLRVLPAQDVVRRSLDRLESRSDIQVVLSHMGFHADSVLATQLGSRIDLIIGGHSHTELHEPVWVNGVPIVQAGEQGRWLGVVEMTVDTVADRIDALNGRLVRTEVGRYPEDAEVAAIVERQEASLADKLDEVVAELKRDWVRVNRQTESNVGQWMADALREHIGTDIAVINTGGLRADITAGPLTIREIMQVAPFGNEVVRFELSADQVRDYVRHEVTHTDRLMIPSGLTYHARRDGTIEEILVNGEPLDDSRTYSVATLSYVTDHFPVFFGWEGDQRPSVTSMYILDRDALVEEARQDKVIDGRVQPRMIVR